MFLAITCTLLVTPALAQERPRMRPQALPRHDSAPRGDTGRPTLALEGYCPVSIMETQQWTRGKPEHAVEYDDKIYRMAGPEQQQSFQNDPAKYVPAAGGDCIVSLADYGQRVPGDVRYAAYFQGRLYLFSTEAEKIRFRENRATYATVDLAFDGKCPVALVDRFEEMPGEARIAAYFRGMRYLFSGAEQRDAFLANPVKYAERPRRN